MLSMCSELCQVHQSSLQPIVFLMFYFSDRLTAVCVCVCLQNCLKLVGNGVPGAQAPG